MIVSAGIVESCRALAATWEGGVGMWITPLYTGPELTHYISTGVISEGIAQYLPCTDYSGDDPVTHAGDIPGLVDAINTDNPEAGATVEGITALLAYADISNQDWPAAVARMGLTQEAS